MKNYKVTLNNTPLTVYDCDVSAIPFNSVWPGHQRPKNQTEKAYFVTMDIDQASELAITVTEDFQDYEIRPLAYDMPRERKGNTVTVTVDKPMQFTFEADGYHNVLHVFVNAKSEKPAGDNVIYYGKGEHHVGLIWLKSHQTLYLEEGAVVHGAIYGKDVEDIRIMGRGILDSSRYRRHNDMPEDGREIYDALREKIQDEAYYDTISAGGIYSSIVLYNCKDVLMEGITVKDTMSWGIIVRNHCKNVTIDNLKIVGQWRYNSDGIDICASQHVVVKNCFIRAFDDCFVARSAYLNGETEAVDDVLVENCVMWCDWGKSLEVWCGHRPCVIRNVTFRNNYLIRLSNLAISITSWYGSENTLIENIRYENIFVDADKCYRNLEIESKDHSEYSYSCDFVPSMLVIGATMIGRLSGHQTYEPVDDTSMFHLLYRNISFENVRYNGKPLDAIVEKQGSVLDIQNVTAKDCDFEIREISK